MSAIRDFVDFITQSGPNFAPSTSAGQSGSTDDEPLSDDPPPGDAPPPDDPPPSPKKSVRIDPPAARMEPGSFMEFRAVAIYEDGERDLTSKVLWRSDNEDVVTVDANGRARAKHASPKTISITAEFDDDPDHGVDVASAEITVTANQTSPSDLISVAIDPPAADMASGTSKQFRAIAHYDNREEDMTSKVTWNSANEDVVIVDALGIAIAKSPNAAPVSIEAVFFDGSFIASSEITVTTSAVGPTHQNPRNPVAPRKSARQPTLRMGDNSPDGWVEYLQELLGLEPTGNFDRTTKAAVLDYQANKRLMVDGIVGNQTWASLRHDNPEAPGVDGRAPGFVDHGQKARWYTVDQPFLYSPVGDIARITAVSVGDADLQGGGGTVAVTDLDGNTTTKRFTIGGPSKRTPNDQGDQYWVVLKDFSKTFNVSPEEVQQCKIELTFDAELGGDYWTNA
jgi:peptidoglycan hydrolase-like protein with peptidoglycan-binding domain